MKEQNNINKLTDFALDSFNVKNPLKKKTAKCPTCQREFPIDEFDSFECYGCANLRAELYHDNDFEEKDQEDEDRRDYLESIYF